MQHGMQQTTTTSHAADYYYYYYYLPCNMCVRVRGSMLPPRRPHVGLGLGLGLGLGVACYLLVALM
eukprot:scaffold35230_cov34-Phaeocystis_antarctica.AAC.2